jgi:hypothetical protein
MTWLRILSVEELAAAQRAVEETVSWPGISPERAAVWAGQAGPG